MASVAEAILARSARLIAATRMREGAKLVDNISRIDMRLTDG